MSTCTVGFDYTDIRPEDVELEQWIDQNIPEAGHCANSRQMARTQAQWDGYVRMLKEHLLEFKAKASCEDEIKYGAFHESHRLREFDDDGNLVPEWRPKRLN